MPRPDSSAGVTVAGPELIAWADARIEVAHEVARSAARSDEDRFRADLLKDEERARVRYLVDTLANIHAAAVIDAAGDRSALERADADYLREEGHLREGLGDHFALQARLRISLQETPAQTGHWLEDGVDRFRYRLAVWAPKEIALIADAFAHAFDRLPPSVTDRAHGRIRLIIRQAGVYEGAMQIPGKAMDWLESAGRLRVFDAAFDAPDDVRRYVVHEIGHSTYAAGKAAGGFAALPPPEWMRLSDWRLSTDASLARDLGLSQRAADDLVLDIESDRSQPYYLRAQHAAGGRIVVSDPGEPVELPATRFFHYAERADDVFVSTYARTSPAEDYAESFAVWIVESYGEGRRALERSGPARQSKADWLTARFRGGGNNA